MFDSLLPPIKNSLLYAGLTSERGFFNKFIKATDRVAPVTLAAVMQFYPSHENVILEGDGTHADLTRLTYHGGCTFCRCCKNRIDKHLHRNSRVSAAENFYVKKIAISKVTVRNDNF